MAPTPHEYEVLAVRYGSLSTTRSHLFFNYSEYGEPDAPAELSYYFWVVRGDAGTVVIDTGYSREAGARRGRDLFVDPPEALASLGIGPDFAGTVVITHAHYDHIGNLDYFTRADFVMAEAEYEFWTGAGSRLALFANLIEPREIAHLRELRASGRLRLITENEELLPGVRIVFGTGHTPGQLMVEVRSADETVLLTSDAVHVDEELERDMPFRHMTDLPTSFETYEAIRAAERAGAHVHVGHEPSVPQRYAAGPIPSSFVIGRRSPTLG